VVKDIVKSANISSGGSSVSWSVTFAAAIVRVQVSPYGRSLVGSMVQLVGPPDAVAAIAPLTEQDSVNQSPVTVTGSVKVTVMLEPTATSVAPSAGDVPDTAGAASPGSTPQLAVWVPRPSAVSVAKPSHSTEGSKAFEPSGSPAHTSTCRRSVLSAVDTNPEPHSVPGSNPICPITSRFVVPLRSTTASSPLNQPAPLVWSAWARIAAFAEECATTNTSPFATVPVRLIVSPADAEPLKNIWTL